MKEIKVGGIWLRTRLTDRLGGENLLEVLAEVNGEWRVVIKDYYDGDLMYSHIVEPIGIVDSPKDEVTNETSKCFLKEPYRYKCVVCGNRTNTRSDGSVYCVKCLSNVLRFI